MFSESVRVAASVLRAIESHARTRAPDECCGLLILRDGRITEAVAAENRAAEPRRRYEIDPRDYLAALKRVRGTGALVIGAYHSHPRSSPEPSETDRRMAFGDFLYLIAGPVDETFAVRGFRLVGGNFRPVRLVPAPEEPPT